MAGRRRPRRTAPPLGSNLTPGTLLFIMLASVVLAMFLAVTGHGRWLNGFYESDILGSWSASHLLVERNEYGGLVNYPLERPEAWRGYAIVLLAVMHLPGLLLAAASFVERRRRPWWWEAASGFVIAWYASLMLTTTSGRFSSTSPLERALDMANDEIVVPVARSAAIGAALGFAVLAAAQHAKPGRRAPRGIILLALPFAVVVPFVVLGRGILFG